MASMTDVEDMVVSVVVHPRSDPAGCAHSEKNDKAPERITGCVGFKPRV